MHTPTHQRRVTLSVVVPNNKDEANTDEFVRRLTPIVRSITTDYEIIFEQPAGIP